MINRISLLILAISSSICLLCSWSWYRSAYAASVRESAAYQECQRLVSELHRHKNAPRIASLEVEPPDRIAARVTNAAAAAELSSLSIASVDPQVPVRIGRSAYQVRATQIVIQTATLRQIATFAAGLEEPSSGMIVRDLSLRQTASIEGNDSELWNARLTLTQMIFSPISPQ